MGRSKTDASESYFEERGFQRAIKTVEFDGVTPGNGAMGTAKIFDVNGEVMIKLLTFCTESLVGTGATVSVGTTSSPVHILPQAVATTIDAGMIWNRYANSSYPSEVVGLSESTTANVNSMFLLGSDRDLLMNNGTAITDGTLKFVCFWRPITPGSEVTSA